MDIRAQLEKRLTEYVEETLGYIQTVRDFCEQEENWTFHRNKELEKMRHISENQEEKEKLDAILKDTLEGLKKLEPFLDALEKLTVTSSHVFIKEIFLLRGESTETVQSVISDARIDAPVLILFRRDEQTFFQPLVENVNILIHQLDNYVLNTQLLCRRVRDSALAADIYNHNKDKPSVQLIVNMNEEAMQQMLDHLEQLCEIRMNQDTRLAFLFQEDPPKFIIVFSVERRSRMRKFLSDLEETAKQLDSMKEGASISNVVGSSVGIVGGVLSIAGLILAPFTAGLSLAVSGVGIGLGALSGVNTLVTGVTEATVNNQQEHNAQSYLQSYKEDMIKIVHCLNEVANSERPLVQPSAVNVKTVLSGGGELLKDGGDAIALYAAYESEEVTAREIRFAVQDLEAVSEVPEVASSLVTLEELANMKTLRIAKVSMIASSFANAFFIGLDIYNIVEEGKSLAHGSKSEVSSLIRSRAALFKSELDDWEKMYNSLHTGIETFSRSKETLEKAFLPEI